jgi:hypothetical protein
MQSLNQALINLTRKAGDKVISALERTEMRRIIKTEVAESKKAYTDLFALAPGDFETLGLRLKQGHLTASHYFDGCQWEYEGFRKVWNKAHDQVNQLPEYF